jgi:hypothetical protein
MSLSHLPPWLSRAFNRFGSCLDQRTALRVPVLMLGMVFASGRRTATSWFRAGGITHDFRPAYHAIYAVGRRADSLSLAAWHTVQPCVAGCGRLVVAIDDTPTRRYGPCIEGAGLHHNPTPGPAGECFVYGHVWVSLAVLAKHPRWGTVALPLRADLYVRQKNLDQLPPEYGWTFRTKLELAADQLRRLKPWVEHQFAERWVVVDGAYANKVLLKPAREQGFVVVGRLRKNAALWSVPPTVRRPGQRGPLPTYGKERLSLAKRAGQSRGWEEVDCVQYGKQRTKTIKTFLATWKPAGGVIRVVIVKEDDGWLAFFSTDPQASVADMLTAAADRGAHEQTFKGVKEVWGAAEQQLRNVYANVGAFNLNAWERSDEELVDRSRSPWDTEARRPSHADKRKTLQREVLRQEIEAVLSGPPKPQKYRQLVEQLLELAG